MKTFFNSTRTRLDIMILTKGCGLSEEQGPDSFQEQSCQHGAMQLILSQNFKESKVAFLEIT